MHLIEVIILWFLPHRVPTPKEGTAANIGCYKGLSRRVRIGDSRWRQEGRAEYPCLMHNYTLIMNSVVLAGKPSSVEGSCKFSESSAASRHKCMPPFSFRASIVFGQYWFPDLTENLLQSEFRTQYHLPNWS